MRLWALYRTPQGQKLFRYAVVSVVSAVIAFSILTVVYGVLQLWTEVPSVLFSNILSTIPNYYLNRRWVWGKSGRSHLWREVVPYWVMSISGMLLALVTASLAHRYSNAHDLGHVTRTIVVVGANSAAFGLIWVLKYLILNRLFQHLPASDTETTDGTPTVGAELRLGHGAPIGPGVVPVTVRVEDPSMRLTRGRTE